MQQEHHFETMIKRELNYLLFLPKDYAVDVSRPWPLILFLHGMGERGDNLELVKLHGIARIVDEQPDFPFIAVSPQCPINSIWPLQIDTLKILLEDVMGKYAVDEKRVYLTGLSMGGYGSWAMGAIYPEMFAAVAPICGGGSVSAVCALKDTPVWAFHGEADPVVPLYEFAADGGRAQGLWRRCQIDHLPRRRPRLLDADLQQSRTLRLAAHPPPTVTAVHPTHLRTRAEALLHIFDPIQQHISGLGMIHSVIIFLNPQLIQPCSCRIPGLIACHEKALA